MSLTLMAQNLPMVQSPAALLKNGIQPEIMPFEMLWGRYEGPMGATAAAVIIAGAVFLIGPQKCGLAPNGVFCYNGSALCSCFSKAFGWSCDFGKI